MLTIGFTNHYYTLWSVTTGIRYDATTGCEYQRTNFQYLQNLSMDFEVAKEKIVKLVDGGEYEIDLELRGDQGTRYFTERMIKDMDLWRFTFGKLTGVDMLTSNDVWQLERAMKQEPNIRRRVFARRRLIQLGELVKRVWKEKVIIQNIGWDPENPEISFKYIKHNWMPKRLDTYYTEIGDKRGLFFKDGERVEISIRKIKSKNYESAFGTVFIVTYETEDGKVVTYKGSSPIENKDGFTPVKCTIKHSDYNGIKQTYIQRIKVLQTI
jgi:hypothetical protein